MRYYYYHLVPFVGVPFVGTFCLAQNKILAPIGWISYILWLLGFGLWIYVTLKTLQNKILKKLKIEYSLVRQWARLSCAPKLFILFVYDSLHI